MVGDAQANHIVATIDKQVDVKYQIRIGWLDLQIHRFHVLPDGSVFFHRHRADDFQFLVRVAGNDARADGSRHAMELAGIGHDDTLHVLDNIAADKQAHLVRGAAKNLGCLGCRIGKGNGFGAAHGRAQFFLQNLQILVIQLIAFFHGFIPP